jgi:hypothetical protein
LFFSGGHPVKTIRSATRRGIRKPPMDAIFADEKVRRKRKIRYCPSELKKDKEFDTDFTDYSDFLFILR